MMNCVRLSWYAGGVLHCYRFCMGEMALVWFCQGWNYCKEKGELRKHEAKKVQIMFEYALICFFFFSIFHLSCFEVQKLASTFPESPPPLVSDEFRNQSLLSSIFCLRPCLCPHCGLCGVATHPQTSDHRAG